MDNRLDTDALARIVVRSGAQVEGIEHVESLLDIAYCAIRVGGIPELVSRDGTFRAVALLAASDQSLLRIVPNVRSEDRVAAEQPTVTARHRDTILPCCLEGRENLAHACVEEVGERPASSCLVGEMLEI